MSAGLQHSGGSGSGAFDLDMYRYDSILSLDSVMSSNENFNREIKNLYKDIVSLSNLQRIHVLSLFPRLLEQYNISYAEKWIRRLDENFLAYFLGRKPALNVPQVRHSRYYYLLNKYFSGDVSGMIAESVFVYLLDDFGVDINLVGHLRPFKKAHAYLPDFVIWDSSAVRLFVRDEKDVNACSSVPIFAEVKGSTEDIDIDRIKKAVAQLNKVIVQDSQCGLIFIFFNSSKASEYIGVIIGVRRQ